ncbi:MAG: tRNA lysidine(34) synthetase TilS [Flavobacteriales bacterium]|nr:tRNA lysidine(34) synthetase TilS [Flavobacteriales bacterium]
MHKAVEQYIWENELFLKNEKILLAVSGGVDSVVMAHIFNVFQFDFDIAHCNFCLRKKESDEDQHFVENIAKQLNVKCHVKVFKTDKYAKGNKVSIQMAARELRYAWFDQLLSKNKYSYVAVGTHLNDAIETFILNAIKGTGISGLRGIQSKNGTIIRPLLFATKQQIENYATENNIDYRQDKSNESTKYLRNKIRHQVIPTFKEINPSLESTFKQNFSNLTFVEQIYFEKIESLKNSLISTENGITVIDFIQLKQNKNATHYLYEFIKLYGFTFSDCEDIIQSTSSGKRFLSENYLLVINRSQLLIQKINTTENTAVLIKENTERINTPLHLEFSRIKVPDSLISPQNVALIDIKKIKFPLQIRCWKQGDFFYPLGMSQKKKLSDFFVNTKLSVLEKKNTFVLTSNDEIVWIIGHRIDNRYRISTTTDEVLKISMNDIPG